MNSYEAADSCVRPQSRARSGVLPATLRVLALCLALLVPAMLTMDLITNSQGLAAYTSLLLGYLYGEAKYLRARAPHLFWINPVVLASIFTFVMAFGVTNLLYFLPEAAVALVGLHPNATPWMNQLISRRSTSIPRPA